MKFSYKIVNHSLQGKSHYKNDIPCQDKTYFLDSNNIKVASLSDGAGSCKYSHIGAEIATKLCAEYVVENFHDIYDNFNNETIGKEIFTKIINQINLDIEQRTKKKVDQNKQERTIEKYNEEINHDSDSDKISVQDYSSTLLFVAFFNDKYIIGHIGDGLIAVNDEKLKVLSDPDNGETSNSTFFFTHKSAEKHLRLKKGRIDKSTTFILMSDGTYECIYDRQEKEFSAALYKFIEWIEEGNQKDVSDAILSNMEKHFLEKTLDDCSISILHISTIKSLFDKVSDYVKINLVSKKKIKESKGQ